MLRGSCGRGGVCRAGEAQNLVLTLVAAKVGASAESQVL